MNYIIQYIKSFLSRAGSYILIASILSRALSFLASWIALQLIPNKELGIVLFAYTIVFFLTPIGGFGLQQGLIRYGPLLKTVKEKESLFIYAFKKGSIFTIVLILIIIFCSFLIPFQFENTKYYLAALSIILLPNFLFELMKIQFRLQYSNKKFAYTEIIYALFLVVSVLLFSYLYQEKGYVLALLLTPTLSVFFFIKKLNINFSKTIQLTIIDFQFWKYGFFASLSSIVTQLLLAIDTLLIGYLLKNAEMVTVFKYVSLIPLSLLFLPMVFINTDFVTFTENIYNKKYIHQYIKSYVLLFSAFSLLICPFFILFSKPILNLFEINFDAYTNSFLVLIFGVCGILTLRGLFGNLLSSIGKAHINFYITGIALLLNVASNYFLIPKYGILGASITSAALMWFTGIYSCISFLYLYRKFILNA